MIVGAGQAGGQAAFTLREQGFGGRIVLVGNESHPPYMRPPLSKKFLAGDLAEERLYLRPPDFYSSHDIELRLGCGVEELDVRAARIDLADGGHLEYDKLLIATGARPRMLDVPGGRGPAIHYLRGLADSRRLRESFRPGSRIAIVGGGYIGLEVAATAATAGARVSVLEVGTRVLGRVTSPVLSAFLTGIHRSRGVEIRCDTRVVAFAGEGPVDAVVCDDPGGIVKADIVVVGIGAEPNDELARSAGLSCHDGIVVDERCRTTNANVFAAGDCTRHPNRLFGRALRLESVQNAVDQATVAALNMCGQDQVYAKVPWFWSQQYEFKLQSAGLLDAYDEFEERGDRESGSFALLYRKGGALVACDAVNMPGEYLSARREIEAQALVASADASRAAGQRAA